MKYSSAIFGVLSFVSITTAAPAPLQNINLDNPITSIKHARTRNNENEGAWTSPGSKLIQSKSSLDQDNYYSSHDTKAGYNKNRGYIDNYNQGYDTNQGYNDDQSTAETPYSQAENPGSENDTDEGSFALLADSQHISTTAMLEPSNTLNDVTPIATPQTINSAVSGLNTLETIMPSSIALHVVTTSSFSKPPVPTPTPKPPPPQPPPQSTPIPPPPPTPTPSPDKKIMPVDQWELDKESEEKKSGKGGNKGGRGGGNAGGMGAGGTGGGGLLGKKWGIIK